MTVEPDGQTGVEGVVGPDCPREGPPMDGAVHGPYSEGLPAPHPARRMVQDLFRRAGPREGPRASLDGAHRGTERVGTEGVGIAEPQEVRARPAVDEPHGGFRTG